MKVKKTTTTTNETSATIDLFEGRNLSEDQKERIRADVGDFLVEQTLMNVADQKSPVAGGQWKKTLSKDYAKKKMEEVGNKKADIQFRGRTLDQFGFEETQEGIKIGVFGEMAPAADGHNNLSGLSELPTRRFIPDVGQKYISGVQKEVDRIIADVVAETTEFKRDLLKNVQSTKDLYAVLAGYFGQMSKAELKAAVFRNTDVLDLLNDEDLLDLL